MAAEHSDASLRASGRWTAREPAANSSERMGDGSTTRRWRRRMRLAQRAPRHDRDVREAPGTAAAAGLTKRISYSRINPSERSEQGDGAMRRGSAVRTGGRSPGRCSWASGACPPASPIARYASAPTDPATFHPRATRQSRPPSSRCRYRSHSGRIHERLPWPRVRTRRRGR